MRQKIVLICGFGGTGKSTVANIIHDEINSNALIEADDLFHIKPFVIGEQMGRIKLRNSLDVINNFLNENYKYVLCVGLVWSQAELNAVLNEFDKDKCEFFLFWLTASKEVRFERVIKRAEPGDTLEWLENVEKNIPKPWPFRMDKGQAIEINTDNKSAQQIAQKIMNLII
jgi:predicted kinase